MEKYLIVGTGGVGGSIAGFLALAGKDVTCIARGKHLEAIREKGLHLRSDLKGNHFLPIQACTAEEYNEKANVIFVCVKGYSLDSIKDLLEKASDKDTLIIPILNVYGTGPRIGQLVPHVTVLDGCIYIVGFVSGPGEITQMGKIFRLVFGARPQQGVAPERLETIADVLRKAGIKADISDDINRDTFIKWSFISAMACTGAYHDVPMGPLQHPGAERDTFIGLSKESSEIGRKMGITYAEDPIDPDIEIFSIFGISIRYYSVLFVTGLSLAYWVIYKLYQDQKIPYEKFDSLFVYCLLGIVIGARLGHCLFYEPGYWLSHPVEMLLPVKITDSGIKWTGYQGLASHGGTIGLMLALWIYSRRVKLKFLTVLDNIAIATPLAGCFIRLGNLMNGEIVGTVTHVPWAFIFPHEDMQPRHPAQLYEAIAYLLIFIIGLRLYKKYKTTLYPGFYFGYCLTTIFTFRFLVEFIKASQEAFEDSMMLNMGQWLSIPFILLGAHFMYHSFKPVK